MDFIDIHQHVLPGLDDGAQNEDEMAQMLQANVDAGTSCIIATPHMTPGMEPIDSDKFVTALNAARRFCKENGLPLRIYPGSEVLYTPGLRNAVQNGRIVTLNRTHYVLIEFLPTVELGDLIDGVECLAAGGYIPVFAHVERYPALFTHLSRMKQLKEKYNVLYQVNCATVISPHDFMTKHMLKKYFKLHMIDFVSSDAHNVGNRKPNMSGAHEVLIEAVGDRYAESLLGGKARHLFFSK